MAIKSLICLMILGLLSSRADDLQAAATPDPDDDILAAQDNQYLSVVPGARLKTFQDAEWRMYAGLNVRANGSLAIASGGILLTQAVPFLSLYTDPLYVLVSLQC